MKRIVLILLAGALAGCAYNTPRGLRDAVKVMVPVFVADERAAIVRGERDPDIGQANINMALGALNLVQTEEGSNPQ